MVERSQYIFVAVMAVVAIGVLFVGELEISLPPWVVPIEAEVAFVNVGVRFTVAPYNGLVVEAIIEEVAANSTLTVVEAVFAELS